MSKHIRHVRQQARRHEEAHLRLKNLLGQTLYKETFWGIFIGTFVMVVVTIVLFKNWSSVTSFFKGHTQTTEVSEEIPPPLVHGFHSGVLSVYMLNEQSTDQSIHLIRQIRTEGIMSGLATSQAVGNQNKTEKGAKQQGFLNSIVLSSDLSKGVHLTGGSMAKGLQKSILTTFYLGEKTIDINSTLQSDAQLLRKIDNALSVDLFAYLNQSASRADSLDGFIHLLETLETAAQERSADLSSKINFLNANSQAQERSIGLTEDAFFENLKIFEGENAETELANFIGLQQEQTEVKAKIGAYQGLKQYYEFFLPKLDNLVRSIKANRDPLIAGVKVVEVQNMTLPLIIREK